MPSFHLLKRPQLDLLILEYMDVIAMQHVTYVMTAQKVADKLTHCMLFCQAHAELCHWPQSTKTSESPQLTMVYFFELLLCGLNQIKLYSFKS